MSTVKQDDKTKKQEPSANLKKALDEVSKAFGTTRQKVDRVFEIGRKEGFSDMEIGNMLRLAWKKTGLQSRGIADFLPQSAKYHQKCRPINENSNHHKEIYHSVRLANARKVMGEDKPENYQSNDLIRYHKEFLIAIIRWYEAKVAELQKRQQEIQALLRPVNRTVMVSTGV